MNKRDAKELLKRFENNQCSPEEEALVNSWYLNSASSEDMPQGTPDFVAVKSSVLINITGRPAKLVYMPYLRYAAAVIIIAGLGFGSYLTFYRTPKEIASTVVIQPGSNKAILTLANGQRINLDDTNNGTIANQGGVTVTKNSKGQVVYKINAPSLSQGTSLPQGKRAVVAYNTIATPNGGQYEVILPDGSFVYLNAASSLKYPVNFDAKERKVSLIGEGYFEITKNAAKPFIVTTTNQSIKVLGTHFNVSCYAKESTTTTLAEGKVEVSVLSLNDPSKKIIPSEIKTLNPGQQSILTGSSLKVQVVDIDDAIAWKDGMFIFDRTPLKHVLTQISRWYDVQIDDADLPNTLIVADIARTLTLSEVLKTLENTSSLKFQLQGRRLSVKK